MDRKPMPSLLKGAAMDRPRFVMALTLGVAAIAGTSAAAAPAGEPSPPFEAIKNSLLYEAGLADEASIEGWHMEGPGQLRFQDGWMHMQSPQEKGHHVFWCPKTFPSDFIAQWQAQHMESDYGLCIVFFAAQGLNGEDILADSLPERHGKFGQYVNGAIRSYHISYYAHAAHKPDRGTANLRKNPGLNMLQKGDEGIATESQAIHQITLVKDGGRIRLWVDDRKVVDYEDADQPYGEGHIGLRQMKWSHFRYRQFRVWSLDND
jgi:hypothetical protein